MDKLISHMNIIIICLSIIGLGTYLYSRIIYRQQYEYLLIIFIISISPFQKLLTHIKAHFCLVATLGVLATFIKNPKADLVIISIAFPLAVNLGYILINRCRDEMKLKIYESLLNFSFTISVFCSLLCYYTNTQRVTMKIIILVTVLPCFYLPLPQRDQSQQNNGQNMINDYNIHIRQDPNMKIKNKLIFYLNPMLCKSWIYALGYSFGIYLNIFEIFSVVMVTKYIKYLVIALLILIQTLTYRDFIKWFCMFIRALLVFHYQRINHNYQSYFIFVYIFLKNFMTDDAINIYLMIGYIVIAIIIWRQQYQISYAETRHSRSEKIHSQPLLLMHERQHASIEKDFQMSNLPSMHDLREHDSGKYLKLDPQAINSI